MTLRESNGLVLETAAGMVLRGGRPCPRDGLSVLQFDVPELIDGACLPENAPLMSVGEEAHELPWQAAPAAATTASWTTAPDPGHVTTECARAVG